MQQTRTLYDVWLSWNRMTDEQSALLETIFKNELKIKISEHLKMM
jgi:hypothetical protein